MRAEQAVTPIPKEVAVRPRAISVGNLVRSVVTHLILIVGAPAMVIPLQSNWPTEAQRVSVRDVRLAGQVTEHVVGRTTASRPRQIVDGSLQVEVPSLGCLLLER
jgi:hypothetical protein